MSCGWGIADLLSAAFSGPKVTANFEVSSVGQYSYGISAEDHGTIVITPKNVTFTSQLNNKSVTGSYTLEAASVAGTLSWVGGQPGDSGLFLQGNAWQIDFAGKPTNGVIGQWHDKNAMIGYDTYALDLDIGVDSTYRLRVSRAETGLFEAKNGRWTRTPNAGPPVSGTYTFSSADLVTMVSSNSSIRWRRSA